MSQPDIVSFPDVSRDIHQLFGSTPSCSVTLDSSVKLILKITFNGFFQHLGIRKALWDLIHADILLRSLLQTGLGQVEALLLLPRVLGQAPPDVVDAPLLGEGLVASNSHLVTLFLTAVLVNQTDINTEE